MSDWHLRSVNFLRRIQTKNGAPSIPDGPITLYGTCYSLLALNFLGESVHITPELRQFVLNTQNEESGLFVGPELMGFQAIPNVLHDRDHLLLHLTCAALPFFQQFSIEPYHSIKKAYQFLDLNFLKQWLDAKDLKHAWFEGNNFLFVGQLLVYLRDVEKHPDASQALSLWFRWLDTQADPKTGLWGTNGHCSPMEAVYGGYHQLLVYYYESHKLSNVHGLVDMVLALQHEGGGFNPNGNGGACEDVDSVDILVNCYKRTVYRRDDIRHALRRCLRHILSTQNLDGGFPYNRDQHQSHMGIPGTEAGPNVSCTFPTWFRIHTLALIAEVLPNDFQLKGIPFKFNKALGMGWHASPPGWVPISDALTLKERSIAFQFTAKQFRQKIRRVLQRARWLGG